jgi:hypothetical protein
MAVDDLQKPPQTWCQHARKGTGCAIYDDRPGQCRAFRCTWLLGLLREELRPDRVHAVVGSNIEGDHLVIYEDAGFPSTVRQVFAPEIRAMYDADQITVIVGGSKRTLIAKPEVLLAYARTKGDAA